MTQMIRLTSSVVARTGDYLMIDSEGVRVVPGAGLDELMSKPRHRTPGAAQPPRERTPGAPRPPAPPRPRDPVLVKRDKEIIEAVSAMPGIKAPDILALLSSPPKANHLAAHLHYMAVAQGLIRREPAIRTDGRLTWMYYPVMAPNDIKQEG